MAPLLILFYPMIACVIPKWDKLFNLEGQLYPVPLSLKHNKQLCKDMQSKLFWYYTFRYNDIKTPKIYLHYINSKIETINELDNSKFFITKPNYGTEGKSIKKIKIEELKNEYYNDMLLQEYIYDCYSVNTRHFRIYTVSFNKTVYMFGTYEYKQPNKYKIASNHANGSIIKYCNNNTCNFLSHSENIYIKDISDKLINLHTNKFKDIPFIGWDVCLTCNGPYVFEGNLGAGVNDNLYNEYITLMNKVYS
jgi:hypothetical protein